MLITCKMIYRLAFIFVLISYIKIPNVVDAQQMTRCNNAMFANVLYETVGKQLPDQNLIFSPFLIQSCAAMIYTGSTGSTSKQLANRLKFLENNKNHVGEYFKNEFMKYKEDSSLKISNKIFLRNDLEINPDYKRSVTENFFSEIDNVNFSDQNEAANTINDWVKNATNHKIDSLFLPNDLTSDTLAVLANAIYFNGKWKYQFHEIEDPVERDFWISQNQSKKVNMMKVRGQFRFEFNEDLNAQILELEYSNSNISMVIVLPQERNGLIDLEMKLRNFNLISLNLTINRVIVTLPKFEFKTTTDLKETFTEMGMPLPFSKSGELNNILKDLRNLYIDMAIQKAYIKVDKRGVEAAAAVGFGIRPLGKNWDGPITYAFYADHPFVFAIKSNSAILFMGRFIKP